MFNCLRLCLNSSQQQLAQLQKEKSEILKNLALYYFTFVDVMEFKVSILFSFFPTLTVA